MKAYSIRYSIFIAMITKHKKENKNEKKNGNKKNNAKGEGDNNKK